MTPEQQDAYNCGKMARTMAAHTFMAERDSHRLSADHDTLMSLWKDRPGFMDGYKEGT